MHKMAVEGEVAALRRRSAELTPALLHSVCKRSDGPFTYTEVRESPLPHLLPAR